MQIGAAHAEYGPSLTGNDPIFILILGSDSRPGTALEDGLCDSIHILGINPKTRRATLVGIPRDSYVPIASGGTNKINVALSQGGPEGMVATVENLTGITFDYYLLTGFERDDADLRRARRAPDRHPLLLRGLRGHRFHRRDATTMTGAETLEYSRTRKSLSPRGLRPVDEPGADPARGVLAVPSGVPEGSGRPVPVDRGGMRNVSTDLPLDELLTLAFTSWKIRPARLTNLVAVGSVGSAGRCEHRGPPVAPPGVRGHRRRRVHPARGHPGRRRARRARPPTSIVVEPSRPSVAWSGIGEGADPVSVSSPDPPDRCRSRGAGARDRRPRAPHAGRRAHEGGRRRRDRERR